MSKLGMALLILLAVAWIAFFCLFFIAVFVEKETVIHYLRCLSLPTQNENAIPSSKNVLKKVVSMIGSIEKQHEFTFLDFGSGGESIDYVYKIHPLKQFVGVELNLTQVVASRKLFQSTNVEFLHMDMKDYIFQAVPTILYMYEPLWCLSEPDAMSLYIKIFDALTRAIQHPLYVIYVAGKKQLLPLDFFTCRSFELTEKASVSRFLGLYFNHVYLLRYVGK
jgi:hypothetical protein